MSQKCVEWVKGPRMLRSNQVWAAVAWGLALGLAAAAVALSWATRRKRALGSIDLASGAASPRVVYINLDRREDRRRHMQAQLRGSGLSWERQAAVDGRSVDLPELVRSGVLTARGAGEVDMPVESKTFGITLTRGAVGCALSHLEAWKRAESAPGVTIVLEDDIELRDMERVSERLRDVPAGWDVVYLGSGQYVKGEPRGEAEARAARRGVHPVSHAFQTIGYVVNPRSARLMRGVFPLSVQVDGALQNMHLRKYVLEPNHVIPRRDMISDIQIMD